MKTALVLSVAVLANSFGNVFLSRGMTQLPVAEISAGQWLSRTGGHVVSNPWMLAGVFLLIVFLAAYLTALSWADLSFVLPATAPAYVLTAFLAQWLLQESISPARWAGTALIIVGTGFVARSYRRPHATREREAERAGAQPSVGGEPR